MRITALVLRDEPEMQLPVADVPVLLDFDAHRPIGHARLKRGADGHVYADMDVSLEKAGVPAVGYRDSEVLCLSIGSGNVDPLIPPIPAGDDPARAARSVEAQMNRDWLDPNESKRHV